jgi:hypothetical protein
MFWRETLDVNQFVLLTGDQCGGVENQYGKSRGSVSSSVRAEAAFYDVQELWVWSRLDLF